jgi:hypothetical protein
VQCSAVQLILGVINSLPPIACWWEVLRCVSLWPTSTRDKPRWSRVRSTSYRTNMHSDTTRRVNYAITCWAWMQRSCLLVASTLLYVCGTMIRVVVWSRPSSSPLFPTNTPPPICLLCLALTRSLNVLNLRRRTLYT